MILFDQVYEYQASDTGAIDKSKVGDGRKSLNIIAGMWASGLGCAKQESEWNIHTSFNYSIPIQHSYVYAYAYVFVLVQSAIRPIRPVRGGTFLLVWSLHPKKYIKTNQLPTTSQLMRGPIRLGNPMAMTYKVILDAREEEGIPLKSLNPGE